MSEEEITEPKVTKIVLSKSRWNGKSIWKNILWHEAKKQERREEDEDQLA